jgi:hypothetical protein
MRQYIWQNQHENNTIEIVTVTKQLLKNDVTIQRDKMYSRLWAKGQIWGKQEYTEYVTKETNSKEWMKAGIWRLRGPRKGTGHILLTADVSRDKSAKDRIFM